MDAPPPLPPLPPALPKRKGLSGCTIALLIGIPVLLVVVALLASIAVPAFNVIQKKAREAQEGRAAAAPPTQPLSTAQKDAAMKFAQQLAKALSDGKGTLVNDLISYDAIVERTFAGLIRPFGTKEGFKRGMQSKQGGPLAALVNTPVKVMRLHERSGFPAITLRSLPLAGGVNFIDLLIKPEGTTFKVVDLYNYLFGTFTTEEARQALVAAHGANTPATLKLLGGNTGNAKSDQEVDYFLRKIANGTPKTVHNAYMALSPETQKLRLTFVKNLQALQALQSEPQYGTLYEKALEAAPDVLGKGSAIDLLLVDLCVMKQDFDGVQKCLDKVLQIVGEDAYLHFLKGMAAVKSGDFNRAAQCLDSAEKLEPDLSELSELRLSIAAAKDDFAAMAAEIGKVEKRRGSPLPPSFFNDAVYTRFRASREYKERSQSPR